MSNEEPSTTLVALQIRNRIIDYLELASSFDEQREYERNVPIAHIPDEVICQWADEVNESSMRLFTEPIFSIAEQAAIKEFHSIWNSVADDIPRRLPTLSELMETEPWDRLRKGAQTALDVFARRGRFDEERDVFQG